MALGARGWLASPSTPPATTRMIGKDRLEQKAVDLQNPRGPRGLSQNQKKEITSSARTVSCRMNSILLSLLCFGFGLAGSRVAVSPGGRFVDPFPVAARTQPCLGVRTWANHSRVVFYVTVWFGGEKGLILNESKRETNKSLARPRKLKSLLTVILLALRAPGVDFARFRIRKRIMFGCQTRSGEPKTTARPSKEKETKQV